MASFIKGTSGQTLVNFKRYTKLLRRIEALLLYQDSDFRIIDNFQQMRCIDDQLRSSSVQPDPTLDRWIEKKSKEVAQKEHEERNLFSNEIARLRGGRP